MTSPAPGPVLLTGASGFLGAHTTARLLAAGHRVRALVRSEERYAEALEPFGLGPDHPGVECTGGDMTDPGALAEAVAGCGAVVHTAATVSMARPDRARVVAQNERGTRTVLEAGVAAGCRSVVHVSSVVALARPGGATLDERSPLGPGLGPYSESKVAAERVARRLQDEGAPVTVVHPGAVLGPHAPTLSDNNWSAAMVLRGLLPVWPRGCMEYVDVRDTADVLVAAASRPGGGRYLVPGRTAASLHRPLAAVTGRWLPVVRVPAAVVVAGTAPGYLTGWPFLPSQVEAARLLACANPVDASATTRDLGVAARPLEETLADTVRWLVDAGHVPPRAAGRLRAPEPARA